MEEKKFPIYKFYASWDQDDFENNFTDYSIMYKENPSAEQLEEELKLFKLDILAKHNRVIFKNAEYEFVEEETWCLKWFNHYTLNQFENDSEIERSFSAFVSRKKSLGEGKYCLMGAEDRYRWNICHCEHCKTAGKITIDH